jgi:thiol-disulfide isomerase/thioredoxin
MIRWTVAAVAAVALALLTLNVPLPDLVARTAADGVCEANGKMAPLGFALKDLQNKDVRLSDFKGKVLVIDFWATWCGPCKLEIPGFVDLQAKYGSQGLQFVGISIDDKVEQLKPFVAQFKMNYPVLQGLGHDEVQDAFGPIWGIPVTVLIGRDGRICRKHPGLVGRDIFEHEIKSLL